MPRRITQYNVFIGSPGGLTRERKAFCAKLERFSLHHGQGKNLRFHPVGWEDTIGGVGRPQALINEDLKQCDYAVFVLHDRWGSPTGPDHTSGTAEEWDLAQELLKTGQIRNIALFFKSVAPSKLADPGEQLKQVLAFKEQVERERNCLFKQYAKLEEFSETLDGHLATWADAHDKADLVSFSTSDTPATAPRSGETVTATPDYEYWISEAIDNSNDEAPNHDAALFCASKALDLAKSDIDWAKALNIQAVARFHSDQISEAFTSFSAIANKFESSIDPDRITWHARGLINKGACLGALDRSDEAIVVYDHVLARFATATELTQKELVANALFNKGVRLRVLGRTKEAIAVYDDLIARYGTATERPLRGHVACAVYNKAVNLGELERTDDENAVYDDLITRFGADTEFPLRERVANALFNKAVNLGDEGRSNEAIVVCTDLIARFAADTELSLRELVADATMNKAFYLGTLGRTNEAIAAYNDLIARFGMATELPLREKITKAERLKKQLEQDLI